MSKTLMLISLAAAAGLIACEKAPEKAAEKAIESAMQKDGAKAKVDLSAGSAKITTTDASGKTTHVEMGAAKVSEADLGLPFYPGTTPAEGASSRISTPEGSTHTVVLHTADPADKVAAFYRERLKAMSAGKQLMDVSGGDGGANLLLVDDQSRNSIQVHVAKTDKGTDVQIIASKAATK